MGFSGRTTRQQLVTLLEELYPGESWEKLLVPHKVVGGQKLLQRAVRTLFPVGSCYTCAVAECCYNRKTKSRSMRGM